MRIQWSIASLATVLLVSNCAQDKAPSRGKSSDADADEMEKEFNNGNFELAAKKHGFAQEFIDAIKACVKNQKFGECFKLEIEKLHNQLSKLPSPSPDPSASPAASGTPQASSAPGTYAASVMADHPVQYWRMNETSGTAMTNQVSGGVTGTYNGHFKLGDAGPVSGGSAVTFMAVNASGAGIAFPGYASAPSVGPISANGSVEFWVNASSSSSIFNPAVVAGFNFLSAPMQSQGGAKENLLLEGSFGFTLISATGDVNPFRVSMTSGSWNHIVATWDSSQNKVWSYLNGALIGNSGSVVWRTGKDSGTSYFGGIPGGIYPYFLHGSIAEIAVYNTTLSADQIQKHYNSK